MRFFGSRKSGAGFDHITVKDVWNKGNPIPGSDPAMMRSDACGAIIVRDRYGMTLDGGWEIDHICPVSMGGSDDLSNLQPLEWRNNRAKADNYPKWYCAVRRAA